MRREEVAQVLATSMMRGAITIEDFNIANKILRDARQKSRRKNTILFALFNPRFCQPGMNILVRLNAGTDKESRKITVSPRKVSIRVNKRHVPQVSVIGDVLEDGNKIRDAVSLGCGTEVINFISANK